MAEHTSTKMEKCANECQLLTIGKIEVVSMYKERSRGRREVREE